jgi:class 3 adenylate cyclase
MIQLFRDRADVGLQVERAGHHVWQATSAHPVHRSIVAVDIEGSTRRTNPIRARLRQLLYGMLEKALTDSEMTGAYVDPIIDRGDGALILVKPADHLPKTLLLNNLIPSLHHMLDRHNTGNSDQAFRLRAAVHSGEVHYDARGIFGEAVDITCRLLDSHELKEITRSSSTPLTLAISDDLYHAVVRHGYFGIHAEEFTDAVRVEVGGQIHRGWILQPAMPAFIPAAS